MAKKGIICAACGKIAQKAQLRFQGHDARGWRCSCGEEYFDTEDAQRILLLNKVRKTHYKITLGQMRSNLILRVPKEVADALGLKKGEEVSLKADKKGGFHVVP